MGGVVWRLGGACAVAALVSGCAIGGFGAIGPVASAPPPAPAAPPPVNYGAFLEGPIGQKLSATDRDKALASEQDALATGQRKTWRGDKGIFGYVEPGPAPANAVAAAVPTDPAAVPAPAGAAPPAGDVCRSFTSTIYIAGRPQVGHGKGCQNPDGTYHIVG